MASNVVHISGAGENPPERDQKRERSTIAFPYGDLEDAIVVATAVFQNAGGSQCSADQLAAWMNHDSMTSGAFRVKLATARTFGVIDVDGDLVILTDLGRQIVDPHLGPQARVQSFLTVPLYKALFENYRGFTLPRDVALEQQMVSLGVATKQKQKARQAFQRSAEQAGFFAHGRNKLVMPGNQTSSEASRTAQPHEARSHSDQRALPQLSQGGGGPPAGGTHALIQGLFQTLPVAGSLWPTAAREQWLQAADYIFRLVYTDDEAT